MNTKSRLTPLLLALCLIVGIIVGTFYANHFSGNRLSIINTGSNKVNYLLQMVDNQYVDTVDMKDLVEKSMPKILSELDPHSLYIPANDAEEANDDLKGSFSGVGISFNVVKDSVSVMGVIPSGPAERVGIMPGDRIVKADTTNLVGASQQDVLRTLRGEKGSKVQLTVVRPGRTRTMKFSVIRGDIPVKSVDAAYMIRDNVGYIPTYTWKQDGAIRVLPSGKYLDNRPSGMDDENYQRMVASYYEIVEVLGDKFQLING